MLKDLQKFFDDACKPAQFWMILGMITIVMQIIFVFLLKRINPKDVGNNIFELVILILWVLAVGWIFNWLCRMKMTVLSWALVLLPYVLWLLNGVLVLLQTGDVTNQYVVGGIISAVIIAIGFGMMNGKK